MWLVPPPPQTYSEPELGVHSLTYLSFEQLHQQGYADQAQTSKILHASDVDSLTDIGKPHKYDLIVVVMT
jgi:hypothetical protein